MKTDAQWSRIGRSHHHGICVVLSSLRSKSGSGIGEFLDLLPLIDWCSEIGLDTIQLLPLNDSGPDPSPYNALSSCALEPTYLSLNALPDLGPLKEELDLFAPLQQLPRVDYASVKAKKIEWLRKYFLRAFPSLSSTSEYRAFLKEHLWAPNYALFKCYKEEFHGIYWRHWPQEAQRPTPEARELKKGEMDFYLFCQFLCSKQLSQVREKAEKKRIFLKGDIPILLSPDSADVWAQPHLFDFSLVAGAPPDFYNKQGQKWGFPLFDWRAMEIDGYAWWKQRLGAAATYYHMYRIDHVVGLFRLWSIPPESPATEGHFTPKDPHLWPEHGRRILEMMIDSSPLLPMAEDLGLIPPFVPEILKELGICGTKVIRWQRTDHGDWHYIPYSEYEPLSLTTVSTHDSETLALWWQRFPDEASAFARFKHWHYTPELSRDQRLEILRDSHHTASYFHINLLKETLALFPELVSPNPEEERLNVPGTISPTNWTYRYRPFVEEIVSHQPLKETFQRIIQ